MYDRMYREGRGKNRTEERKVKRADDSDDDPARAGVFRG